MTNWRSNGYARYVKGETLQHIELVEWLNHVNIGLWIHYPAEGKRSKFEQFLWVLMGGKDSIPDFLFFDPIGRYKGLALELKDKGIEVYTKKNVPKAAYKKQHDTLEKFRKVGWKTTFASGRDEAIKVIKTYYKMQ